MKNKTREEYIEAQVVSLTRKIHPQDLGEETSKLENMLRQALEEVVAEERERVRGIVKRTIGINTTTTFDEVVYKNGIDVKEYINKYDLISSLDRPDK